MIAGPDRLRDFVDCRQRLPAPFDGTRKLVLVYPHLETGEEQRLEPLLAWYSGKGWHLGSTDTDMLGDDYSEWSAPVAWCEIVIPDFRRWGRNE